MGIDIEIEKKEWFVKKNNDWIGNDYSSDYDSNNSNDNGNNVINDN